MNEISKISGETVRLAYAPYPFAREIKIFGAAAGGSIAEILADLDALPPGFAEHGEVRINDHAIPRELWSRVRPKPDTPDKPVIVTLHVAPGSSGTLRTVATIAVLVAAVVVSAGALGPAGLGLLGSSFAAGGIGAALAGAGVAIAGQLAIAALTPAPTLTDSVATSSADFSGSLNASPGGGASGGAAGGTAAASLSGNVVSKGRPLPRSIGTNRMFPPLACQPLVDLQGIPQYEQAEAIYILAGPHQIFDIRIGDTPVGDMPEVSVEVNDGTNPAAYQVSLITRQGATDQVGIEMSTHTVTPASGSNTVTPMFHQSNPNADVPAARVLTSRQAPDEIWIPLSFAQGLYYTKNAAQPIVAPFRIRMRQKGFPSWINLPELHVSTTKVDSFELMLRLIWGTAPSAALLTPNGAEGAIRCFKTVPGQSTHGVTTAGWTADAWFSAGSGKDVYSFVNDVAAGNSNVANVRMAYGGAAFYLGGATFPQTTGGVGVIWEIEITQLACYRNSDFAETTYVYTPVGDTAAVYDFLFYFFTGTVYAQPWDLSASRYKAYATRISSVWNQNPVQAPDFTQIAVTVRGRQLGALSCQASAYVPDWNGSAWTGNNVTSNPAPHFRAMLVDSAMNKSALPASLLDDPQLLTWRTRCIAKGYQANCVLEGQSLLDGLNLVAAAGYARPRMSEKWGVVMDYDRSADAPVQVFSARNMKGFSFQKAFPKFPDGLRISFRDAANQWTPTQIEVNDPAAIAFNVYQEISYDSLTTQAAAQARALFDIAQSKLRMAFYSGEVSIESIIATRGDLVAVNHDTLSDFAGAARIKSITRSGGRITQLGLDGTVPGPNSGVMGIAVRLLDGSVWIQATNISSSAETSTITFSPGPLDPGVNLAVDCLLVSGKSGAEYKRMIVFAIEPKQDLSAQITFVDEAPTLPF